MSMDANSLRARAQREAALAQRIEREVAKRTAVNEVADAWAALVALNPDARTLGGPVSRRVWDALDALIEERRA